MYKKINNKKANKKEGEEKNTVHPSAVFCEKGKVFSMFEEKDENFFRNTTPNVCLSLQCTAVKTTSSFVSICGDHFKQTSYVNEIECITIPRALESCSYCTLAVTSYFVSSCKICRTYVINKKTIHD